MKHIIRHLIAPIALLLSGCQTFQSQLPVDAPADQRVIVVGRDFVLRASDSIAWAEPIFNFDHSVAYAVKLDRNSEGWGVHSLTKITKDGIVDPFIARGQLDAGDVRYILNVSDNGRNLRVMLQFEKVRKGSGMYGMRPVILDTITKQIQETGF